MPVLPICSIEWLVSASYVTRDARMAGVGRSHVHMMDLSRVLQLDAIR
jgi:hypothetical protein